MRIGLVSRTDAKAIELVRKIADLLSPRHDLSCDRELSPILGRKGIEEVDVIVVVGGDGTILRTARTYPFPLLTVKMGKHGHLCEVDPGDIGELEEICEEHATDVRMKLEVEGAGEALNEVAVRAVIPDKVTQFTITYGNSSETVIGDGVIVATPTGSTAYSLAAGGPVVENGCPVFCITPICPLERAFFPKVVSSDHVITITADHPCYMALDGCGFSEVPAGEVITVRKSRNSVVFWRKKKK